MNMGHCNDNEEQGNNKVLGGIHVPVPFFTPKIPHDQF